jgi:hypothetical protein
VGGGVTLLDALKREFEACAVARIASIGNSNALFKPDRPW